MPSPRAKRKRREEERQPRKRSCKDASIVGEAPPKLSRKHANALAEEFVGSGGIVTDSAVLAVLRLWKFSNNFSRENVRPHSQSYVHSDTLGALTNRTGRISITKATKEHPAVFRLLASWLKTWYPHDRPFPFTSINDAQRN